jgi:hypothetical protein
LKTSLSDEYASKSVDLHDSNREERIDDLPRQLQPPGWLAKSSNPKGKNARGKSSCHIASEYVATEDCLYFRLHKGTNKKNPGNASAKSTQVDFMQMMPSIAQLVQ